MRKFLCLFIILLAAASSPSGARADDNLLSIGGGLFLPTKDIPADNDDYGLDISASFIRVNEYMGLEFGLNSYYLPGNPYDTYSIGMEMLVHIQKEERDFQPYIALGLGVYQSWFNSEYQTIFGPRQVKSTDTGSGIVAKVGARYYLDDTYFVGAYIKKFANNVSYSNFYRDYNIGGTCLCFEIGLWTD